MEYSQAPEKMGMYRKAFEHDACGIGFIVDVQGRKTHQTIEDAIDVLEKLTHRGGIGADPECGDGAGILMQLPDAYLREACSQAKIDLPGEGLYGAGHIFLPKGKDGSVCQEKFNEVCKAEGVEVLGWRSITVDPTACGGAARESCPEVCQVYVRNPGLEELAFERKLYLVRRLAEKAVQASGIAGEKDFYICSLSSRVINYKGMLLAHQMRKFYPELSTDAMQTAIAMVHQRYSTNTFPSWKLAQPFRMLSHNGEINTLRGNINKIIAREPSLKSDIWGEDLQKLLPLILDEDGSDSACFDNVLEFLALSGRSLAHSILMMVPEAWGTKYYMGHDRRGFYEYHANFMEPWDGPAAIAFTDGRQVGGILDRNGLRPARYTLTKDDRLILASETGVLDIPSSEVAARGRLQPGKMLLVDTQRKRIMYNEEIKAEICRRQHYRRWVDANRITMRDFGGLSPIVSDDETLFARQTAFGYTREDLDRLLRPMAEKGAEPIGSMGNDAPLAVLSDRPQLLYNYFKQKFAQVTNPPIDPIRERLVMSLTTFLGREGNILDETPEHARRLKLFTPIVGNADLGRIRSSRKEEFRSGTIDITVEVSGLPDSAEKAIANICKQAEEMVNSGVTVLILSDRNICRERMPIPALLAVSAVGHHLIGKGLRNRCGLVLETGEPREVNHFALLSSFGCDAVNPYLALETISRMHADGELPEELNVQDALENYFKAINKGLAKILSKMGISTLRSYCGAQVFEALGLSEKLVNAYFPRTATRIEGIGLKEVMEESLRRFTEAYKDHRGAAKVLDPGGDYALRRDGERHLWTPEAIHWLQRAVREDKLEYFQKYAEHINNQERRHTTLRSLFDFDLSKAKPIDISEVESAENIYRRFFTGAMSFGSLSRETHETMAIAMNRLGGMSNSGEGGEDPARYIPDPNGDSRCSGVKQVASGRFGVTCEYLANCKELQIKVAQGAKPGEGGHLPGHKVKPEIAKVRHSTPGVSLISPPPHHDIYSIEDLAQLIHDLKSSNPEARVSVKLVSEAGVGTIAAGVAKGKADMVLISGADGGTGASPLSSIKHAGIPWELGLTETHQTLVMNNLRDRIRVQTDGQMRTGRDVAIATLLGAEEFGFGTASLVCLGCLLMRKCHENTCPVGVATQDPELRKRFAGKPEHLVNFFKFITEDLRGIMAQLGFRTIDEMVGHSDLLIRRDNVESTKANTLDFAPLFAKPETDRPRCCSVRGIAPIDGELNDKMVADLLPSIESGSKIEKEYHIRNIDRTAGAPVAFHIARKYGLKGLPEDTVTLNFNGSAGQSFGAFAASGMTMILSGDCNDYLGKSLSGGKIIVKVPEGTTFDPAENVIVGNTLLYGATYGDVYINGLAGERFCVRNSGATAVVEGVGDHGCEYMTGGLVAVLGRTGVNFAAGMSGGIAYVYDPDQDFDLRCNLDMVDLEPLALGEDEDRLKGLIANHYKYTGSARAKQMLDTWEETRTLFVKVMPMEYRRALGQMAQVELNARQTEAEKVTQA